ncbi:MAG: LysR substrate-binding domain-containing protein [Specibacter sp.]
MELRLLRAFIAIAEHGNFGVAARILLTTQPALTKQIQLLERQSGSVLFLRGRHGAALTAAGDVLLAEALDLVRRADALELRMQRLSAGAEGLLTVGFGLSAIDIAPRAVAAFRASHPGVDITLEDMSSTAQVEALLEGRLGVGFIRLPAPPDIATQMVRRDSLALAMPSGEQPPKPGRQGLRQWFDDRPLIRLVPARGPGLAAQSRRLFTDLDCVPAVLQEASDLLTVLALVAAGVGSAVVPASAASIAPAGVRLLPLDIPSAGWELGTAWLAGTPDPLVPLFLGVVESQGGRPRQTLPEPTPQD